MPYLTAAVILFGAATVLNLLLAVGLIRRLREHTKILDSMSAGSGDQGMPPVGSTPDAFAVRDTAGMPLENDVLTPSTVVGFFSPHCGPCKELAPRFIAYAQQRGEPDRIVTVVVGDGADADALALRFAGLTRVVIEPDDGAMVAAFRTEAYPAVCLIGEDRMIVGSGASVGHLPSASPTAA